MADVEKDLRNWVGSPNDFVVIALPELLSVLGQAARTWAHVALGAAANGPHRERHIRQANEALAQVSANVSSRLGEGLRRLMLSEQFRREKALDEAKPIERELMNEMLLILHELSESVSESLDSRPVKQRLESLDETSRKTHMEVGYIADRILAEQAKELQPNVPRLKEALKMGASVTLEALLSHLLARTV